MRKPEQRLYDTMKRNCADGVRLERVENGVNPGTPDVHAIREGRVRWLELKVVERPARPATTLLKRNTLRVEQVAWHLSYTSCGGHSFIVVRDSHLQLYLFHGSLALQLHEYPLYDCVRHFACNSWQQLYEEIFK